VGLDRPEEVLLVVDDPGDDQGYAGPPGDLDRQVGALVGVDAAEEQQVLARVRLEGERGRVDPVMDGRRVREVRMPVGGADGGEEKPWIVVTTGVRTRRL